MLMRWERSGSVQTTAASARPRIRPTETEAAVMSARCAPSLMRQRPSVSFNVTERSEPRLDELSLFLGVGHFRLGRPWPGVGPGALDGMRCTVVALDHLLQDAAVHVARDRGSRQVQDRRGEVDERRPAKLRARAYAAAVRHEDPVVPVVTRLETGSLFPVQSED